MLVLIFDLRGGGGVHHNRFVNMYFVKFSWLLTEAFLLFFLDRSEIQHALSEWINMREICICHEFIYGGGGRGIERLVERAMALFYRRVYFFIQDGGAPIPHFFKNGLHLTVRGHRCHLLPNLDRFVSCWEIIRSLPIERGTDFNADFLRILVHLVAKTIINFAAVEILYPLLNGPNLTVEIGKVTDPLILGVSSVLPRLAIKNQFGHLTYLLNHRLKLAIQLGNMLQAQLIILFARLGAHLVLKVIDVDFAL